MGDTISDEQRRILKLGHVLKNLNLSHSSKLLLADPDPSQFKELFFSTLDDVNKLSKFLLLPESQIDKENVFKTLQQFLEQQQITGNIKEDLDEFTRYVALDSVFSQLMTLRLCFWRDPTVKHDHEIYAIGQALELEEREPVKILESAATKIQEMKPLLPLHCIEPLVITPISIEHHGKFDEINTQFKEEYARLKLRYVESFDRSFRDMMSAVSNKHEKYLRVKQERARVKIESSFDLWDTYNARWDLVTDLSRCALRRRGQRPKGKFNTADTLGTNTNEESTVKTHVENIQVEHVVTKAQMKYAKLQQAKQKKKDQKKRRKLKELGLLDTEEEKQAELAGDDNEQQGEHDNEGDDDPDGDDNEENKEDEPQPLEPKKKNRNKSEKQEWRLKKKSKKEARAATVAANNNNIAPLPKGEVPTGLPLTKAEKKKQKFVVVVGDDGGVDVGEKN